MVRLYTLVALLHVLIGWRLVPDMPSTASAAAMILWLIVSTVLIPFALAARRMQRGALSTGLMWAGLLALGSFSSLFVLTIIRDVALLLGAATGALLHLGGAMHSFQAYSA